MGFNYSSSESHKGEEYLNDHGDSNDEDREVMLFEKNYFDAFSNQKGSR